MKTPREEAEEWVSFYDPGFSPEAKEALVVQWEFHITQERVKKVRDAIGLLPPKKPACSSAPKSKSVRTFGIKSRTSSTTTE